MTSSSPYPQVFLDANALVRVAYSISHHYRDPKRRKSTLRVFIEERATLFVTGARQLARSISLIEEGATETAGFRLGMKEREIVIAELIAIVSSPEPLLRIVHTERDPNILNECRRELYELVSQLWQDLVHWDEEDRLMIREASLAYAKYGLVYTTKGVYRPRPMALVTDDRQIHHIAASLNGELRKVIQIMHCIKPIKTHQTTNLLHVIGYNELKEMIRYFTIL